jgi:ABC-type nitrate/sulfonate/bicarbonate transport system substrate-binding protein
MHTVHLAKRHKPAVALAGIGLGLAALATPSAASAAIPPLGPVHATITIAAVGSIDGTSFFSALHNGIFHQWGLDAKIIVEPTGVEVMNEVASGAAQFGDVGSDPLLTSVAKGLPLKIIADNHGTATLSYYAENQAIVAGPGTGIGPGDIAGLKGKKIGVALNTDAVGYLQSLLQKHHLKLSDVSLVNMTPADGVTALARKSVDAIATFEPWPSAALSEVKGSKLVIEGNSTTWYDPGVIVSSSSYLASHPSVAEAFLAAVAQSESFVRGHLPQAATIATQWITGLRGPVAQRAIKHVTFDMRMSKLVVSGLQNYMVPFLEKTGAISGKFNVSSAMDTSFMVAVQKARPQFFRGLPPIPRSAQLP